MKFLFPLHPHFVLNLVCFCPSLPLPILLIVMKVVVVVVVLLLLLLMMMMMIIIIISCLFMVVFPSGARMLAADVFLHLKSLLCM